ncbi:MAG TPA: family 16 glycoside hydrolase [Gemmataceae bacterium]|nr:family 16 glycoside hydrolase [Gemmataceae bacterium]
MRWFTVVVAVLIAPVVLPAAGDEARSFTFTKDDVGKLPKGWKADHTGKGEGSVWKVVADDTAPSKTGYALAQTAEGPSAFFNLCVAEDTKYTDLEISVAFKAVRGKDDQGGGVVWRYRDADNYYICRMNPLEDNFRVYKVVGGRRMQLATTKNDVKVPAGEWHTIKVTMKGEEIACFLDGKKHLEAKDATFQEAGKVGLWSKADAQSHFDNLTIKGH